ncbi:ATP-grasp domain-containing protein [Actinomadura macrotermitis]|uniref:Ribosomal protein S6--L-glutamate ligase n=1 Tax=Actinomadura macrotermitis TaxID=2585200 RepID=A0A7K0C0W5_9ACTN|nr:hypothetical protein [Actinomadura macrotermitis]MQY07087.1 Ribosomal protein S6--L-glutamate ligase [Actinomadura macrotermitis]
MRLCFLVEEQYRRDGMPMAVIGQLAAWGHEVDLVRPGGSLLSLAETISAGRHAAWVLKTVSGGPGLSLLEAASSVGLRTINDVRAIRLVRDKVVAAAVAHDRGLPVPATHAAPRAELFAELPADAFPLVVKPADGSNGRAVRLFERPEQLAAWPDGEGMVIAQPYVPNTGLDLKVYCVAGDLYATESRSPLRPDMPRHERPVPLTAELAALAAEVGRVFGLDLYGVDILLGPDGPVIVDINDFPSFRQVPDAVPKVSQAILDLARADVPEVTELWPAAHSGLLTAPEAV